MAVYHINSVIIAAINSTYLSDRTLFMTQQFLSKYTKVSCSIFAVLSLTTLALVPPQLVLPIILKLMSFAFLQIPRQIHKCHECRKSFTRMCYLQLHLKSHRNNQFRDLSFGCCVCEQSFLTSNDLNCHMNVHNVHEQWVEPADVHLSNGGPELHEMPQNLPLVLLENLDVKRINLESLADYMQHDHDGPEKLRNCNANQGSESVDKCDHNTKMSCAQRNLTAIHAEAIRFDRDNFTDDTQGICTQEQEFSNDYQALFDSEVDGPFDQTLADDCTETGVQNTLNVCRVPSSIHSLNDVENRGNEDCLTEALPISVQTIDSTLFNHLDNIAGDVVDISSDDEDVKIIYETSDVYHCYLCDAVLNSLKDLGFHNKLCSDMWNEP